MKRRAHLAYYEFSMRIAFVCPLLPPHYNGCGDATDRLAREFHERGDETLILTDDVTGVTHPFAMRSVGKWDVHSIFETKRALAAFAPDAVLMQYTPFLYPPKSLYPAFALRGLRGVRRIVYAHEFFYPAHSVAVRGQAKAAYLALRDKAAIGMADCVYVAGAARRDALLRKFPGIGARVKVVPFGANVEPPMPLPPRRVPYAPYRLTAFGIVMPRRRIELLVHALASLNAGGFEANLNVVGRIQEPAYRAECENLARELNVGERVRFSDALPPAQLAAEFAQTDLLLHAAAEGAIPSAGSLLAALAHGVPVLCARTEFDDPLFNAAAIFADADPQALASQIRALLSNAQELGRRADLCRRLYEREFGWPRLADAIARDARRPAPAYAAL